MNSSETESTSEPVYTPSSSTTLSTRMPAVSVGRRPEDVPVPSIESSTADLFELSGAGIPRMPAFASTYHSVVDTFKQVNLSPPDNGSQSYHFGQETDATPFTFRCLHNTTPEPSTRAEPISNSRRFLESELGLGAGNNTISVTDTTTRQSTIGQDSTSIPAENVRSLRALSAPVHSLDQNPSPISSKYDINDETPPNEPYFNEEFQKALRRGKSVARRIADILGTCDLAQDRDSQIFSMVETADELSQFDAPPVCIIGIVGDSGVGKSSLMNSLLDETELATTAGLGAACTSVVTEYRLRQQEHTFKYNIEIDCMADLDIEEQLRELLWSYRYFHMSDLDDKSVTADEQKQLEARSKLAWDTLKAAFGSREELTEAYLQDTSAGAEERIQQQLKLWTKALQWPQELHESGWLGGANTVEECNSMTEQFLTGSLWPFIKVIRIFLSSQVLKSGTILADLPGFHDSNHARVKAAEDYMYDCDEIFVVADINRAGTNKNVEEILEKSLGSNLRNGRPSQGITLVCTRSEDLDFDEIRKKFFANGSGADAARVRILEMAVEEAEAEDGKAGALRKRDAAQDELDYIYMKARNNYIENLVRETHAELFNNRTLSVFCISNKMYKKNRRRVKVHGISIKGSGIPALRKHCHKIPSQAQFRIAHHFLTVSLKGLAEKVQLWLAGGSQEIMPNNSTIQRMLETLQNDLTKNASDSIKAAGETQLSTSKRIIVQPMSDNLENWTRDALRICDMWKSFHHTQIAGFCRNYGSWGSSKVTYREWNLELIESMVNSMDPWWNNYAEWFTKSLVELQHTILASFDGLASEVNDFHGAPMFNEALATKVDSVVYLFADTMRDEIRQLESIKRDATQNHQSSYIYTEMRPAYDACSMDSGSGVNSRRLARLRDAIGSARNPVLFEAIQERLEKKLSYRQALLTYTLTEQVKLILKEVGDNIELLRGSEAQILAKNGDFLERLGLVMESVMADMEVIGGTATRVKTEAE